MSARSHLMHGCLGHMPEAAVGMKQQAVVSEAQVLHVSCMQGELKDRSPDTMRIRF